MFDVGWWLVAVAVAAPLSARGGLPFVGALCLTDALIKGMKLIKLRIKIIYLYHFIYKCT